MKSLRLKILSAALLANLFLVAVCMFTIFELYQMDTEEANVLKSFLITVCIIAVVVSVGMALWIANTIVKPIFQVVDRMKMVASGDLSAKLLEIKSKDEISHLVTAMNEMIVQLRTVVGDVRSTAEKVADSAEHLDTSANQTTSVTEQVASAMQQVAAGAESQTSNIEKNVESLEEIAQGIMRVTESSMEITELAKEANLQAEEGGEYVKLTVEQMNTIHKLVKQSDETIKLLAERSIEIGKILEVIKTIADQTDILALNAAIESARAGEHGRGFAVVASEVRKLAEQSQNSAKQIEELIVKVQRGTTEAVEYMSQVTENVEQGFEITTKTAQRFLEIVDNMKKIAPQIEEISAITQQISAGAQQVTAAAHQLAQVARENAAVSEEVAASSEEQLAYMEEVASSSRGLTQMAKELRESVQQFTL
ncbi:HAMP domain-containing methyl-accepting chemotaxis protein [Anoxybacillus salavatliensis]|uniref:methyl-accepting chemotaxis protein n=1 Tax=Anoxybacillus gonensis TaxID=198467 RepID=UPI00214C0CAF|nr:HAMP domain-containing methyl-accepting chemotaxis protein [Anoxybacillus gonensis]MCQ5366125.1 HAMP domain-containing methyl-accepting chemotaxis protein [Anoxybacillus gonensis]